MFGFRVNYNSAIFIFVFLCERQKDIVKHTANHYDATLYELVGARADMVAGKGREHGRSTRKQGEIPPY